MHRLAVRQILTEDHECEDKMDKKRLPPLVKGVPFLGSFFDLRRDALGFMARDLPKYGDIVRIRVGPMEAYVVSHPEHVEWVLRGNHRNFIKNKGTRNVLAEVLGKGLLTSDGELWRRQRRLAQPAFQPEQIRKYSTVMVEFTNAMQSGWHPGETRNIHSDMMRLTLDIVAQTLFTASVGDKAARVGAALDALMKYWSGIGAMFRWWKYLPTQGASRFRQAIRELDSIILDTVAQRRASGSRHEDLLDRFLLARDDDGSRMADKQLRDEMVTLLLAGHETTAVALTFCFYLLALDLQADARLADELDSVLAGRPPTAADIPGLRYTEWVVKETMRLYPPVPSVGREALMDCEIGGYHVPKGAQIAVVPWMTHRDKRWFGEDADKFRPERWDNDQAKRRPRCAYYPFVDGPRTCIGTHFAMMEAVLVLATVASRYRLELAPSYTLKLNSSVTLRPHGGMPMILHQRLRRQT
jgi:cytochrome P450